MEKKALSLYQRGVSPLFLYNELLQIQKPLKFDRLLGSWDIQHAADDESIIEPKKRFGGAAENPNSSWGRYFPACTAESYHVMRAGKHYVTFTCSQQSGDPLWFGLIRPLGKGRHCPDLGTFFCVGIVMDTDGLRDQRPEWGDSNIHACVYNATDGHCQWTDWCIDEEEYTFQKEAWEGMQMFEGNGTIGLLLDYDEGTLTVYKNDIKLGVMKEGLSGEYAWMVSVGSRWFIPNEDRRPAIKIERGSPPETVEDGSVLPQEKRQRIE